MNIIYYLPIFWTISCFIFTLNFVRSRRFLQHQLFKLKQKWFNCKKQRNSGKKLPNELLVKCDSEPQTDFAFETDFKFDDNDNFTNRQSMKGFKNRTEVLPYQGTEIILVKSENNHQFNNDQDKFPQFATSLSDNIYQQKREKLNRKRRQQNNTNTLKLAQNHSDPVSPIPNKNKIDKKTTTLSTNVSNSGSSKRVIFKLSEIKTNIPGIS